ncbi:MAG TPA: alpha/beta hydrolase-fold protein [Clostridia bacterium]|nr:alpha/beta hydrolase-fold protein [Clostridia bacterium]
MRSSINVSDFMKVLGHRTRFSWQEWALGICVLLTACSPREGRIVTRVIQAPSISQNRLGISDQQPIAIYLPPSYGSSQRRFPVLYFLPNFKTDIWRYTGGSYQRFHLKEAIDKQVSSGAMPEMIVVIPNTAHSLGGSCYRNSPLTGQWEDYIVKDVVNYIDSHFRTIPSATARGLSGHGIGGTGALELALKHPNVFGSVYAMSPALFDQNGLRDFGILSDSQLEKWQAKLQQWQNLDESARRKPFRDFIQTHLNSPSRGRFFEGLYVSYAAAVAPDLSLPFPHIAWPEPGALELSKPDLRAQYENGMGGWEAKIAEYLAKGTRLHSITIEYTRDDEYHWLRRGAVHVSGLMRAQGIEHSLEVHEGGHDSTLGQRLGTAMLPTVANALCSAK